MELDLSTLHNSDSPTVMLLFFMGTNLSEAQHRNVRRPNDPISFAVVPQMASPRNVSDDQNVGLGSLRRPIQQLRDIAAIDDDFGLRAYVLLKLGDLFGGETDDLLLPNGIDVGSTGTPNLHAGRDVDERKRGIDGRGHPGRQRHSVAAVPGQFHRTEDAANRRETAIPLRSGRSA